MSTHRPYLEQFRLKTEPPKDDELILSNRMREIPKDHGCLRCEWATILEDRIMCPFVEGSCVKFPHTILEPDRKLIKTRRD